MEGQGFQVGQCIQECFRQGALLAGPEQGISNIFIINVMIIGCGALVLVLDALSRRREDSGRGKGN